MRHIAILVVFLAACAAPVDLPEEAQDADGVGGATAKVEAAKWLGSALLQLITNTTINIKIDNSNSKDTK